MNHSGSTLAEFFQRYRASSEPLILATIVSTLGSTYRKAGAQMLLAADGNMAGLLSGGCLEGDLAAHARSVMETGAPKVVDYDTRTSDDLIWGIGLGCEGAMQILLTRLGPDNHYEPFAHAETCRDAHRAGSFALVVESQNPEYVLGSSYHGDTRRLPRAVEELIAEKSAPEPAVHSRPISTSATMVAAAGAKFLVVPVELPVRLLVLGAGPDAMPLVDIAGLVGWHITVLDHRPAYAVAEHFPRARRVHAQAASALPAWISDQYFDAAVVMSHHLASDEAYLTALADSAVRYVGLLGPAPRRSRLLSDIGARAQQLGSRLYGPIGLDIGAVTPETIALAIVSEIQAVLAGRSGGSFSAVARQTVTTRRR
jgi:xanthine/CO dehydrogenase XdhC/CoxF family maturation factor